MLAKAQFFINCNKFNIKMASKLEKNEKIRKQVHKLQKKKPINE